MPILGGADLARQLAEERPDVRIIFMSGYTDNDVIRRGMATEGFAFVQKPFEPNDLALHVRDTLDQQAFSRKIA